MIKLIKSTFYQEEDTKNKLCEFIQGAKQLSFGPECEKFEENFARYQGRKYCVFVNSGSSANLALVQALLNLGRIKKEDNAGFSSLTWATNVMPLIQLGVNALPIDVEINTLNVSLKTIKELAQHYPIKMLMLTNLLGFCDNLDEISDFCKKENIILVEDNCESLGTVYKGKKLGNWGLASTFSFYVGHHMSTIEGGAICTDDEELATMLKLVRAHGWDRNLQQIQQDEIRQKHNVNSSFYSRYTFYDLGYNLRPTEINGFIGNLQLQYVDEIIQKRQANFLTIASKLYPKTERYFPLQYSHIDFVSNFAVPVVCKSKEIRDELVAKCENIIEIRPIVGGDMTMQPFLNKYEKEYPIECKNARLIHEQGLYFGNNPELTNQEISKIIDVFSRS